ncbi:MAG: phage portal protein [Thermoplasmata archaeon]|nr:phage portal protein [Thermoplasmata archaeon]
MGAFSRFKNFMFGSKEDSQPVIKSNAGQNYNYVGSQYPVGEKWRGGIDVGSTIGRVIQHRPLRAQTREAYHETPQARMLIERNADIVADSGLTAESNPIPEILGITDEAAEEWSDNVDLRFNLWTKSKLQNRSNRMSFNQSQRSYALWQTRDNDMFTRLYYATDSDLLSPLQFDFVDPDNINGYGATSTFGYNFPFDGINRDARGREVSYEVQVQKPTGEIDYVTIPRMGARSKRLFMLHGYSQEYANQGRGYPRLAFALQEFAELTNLSTAYVNKAITHASFAGAIEPSEDEDSSDPFEGIGTAWGTGPAANQFGSNPVPAEGAQNVTSESLEPVTCVDIPEATYNAPNVFFTNLKRGEKITLFDNKAPTDSYNQFVDSFTSYIAAGMSMPLEVALMKFGENFSASRASLLLFWQVAGIWRQEMATDYLNPIREMWLATEIGLGRLSAPGWSDPVLRAAWANCNWFGSPPPDIDPSKTAKAKELNLKLGATTGSIVARQTSGTNFSKNKVRLQKEYGAPPPPPGSTIVAPAPDDNDDIKPEED